MFGVSKLGKKDYEKEFEKYLRDRQELLPFPELYLNMIRQNQKKYYDSTCITLKL
jgi:hypothetical protein